LAYVSLNPSSWSCYGLSPIEVANIQIASDMAANQYNADVFSKNNIPPGILAVMGTSEPEFRRLMAQLRGVSADNPHNIHAMRAPRSEDGAKKLFEYVPLQNTTNREMQYKELLEQTVTRICMVYGVTPSQIGFTEGVTGGIGSGVAETQVDLTQNKGVAPLLQAIADCHNDKVIEAMGWGDLEFAYTQSGTPSQQKEREDDRADVQGGMMTQNEYRAKYGMTAVDWGDLPVLPPPGWQPPMSPEQMQQQMMMQGMGGQPGQDPAQQMPQGMAKSVKRITVKL
jgi:phage portal protein BeeE